MNVSYNSALINPQSVLQATPANFEELALQVFRHQHTYSELYRSYCDALRIDAGTVRSPLQIPFLPISFFKTHQVLTGGGKDAAQLIFESSGTTGEATSRHYVLDAGIYGQSLLQGFEQFYGPVGGYTILALLPSYLERKNASLVHMARVLMDRSAQPDNGFYINEWPQLATVLQRLDREGKKVLLLGVTFALLDFAEAHPMQLTHTIVMETGGMKGRREEMTRADVHAYLQQQWQLPVVHSEYGMTELLSQAYSTGRGIFRCTSTMRTLIRDINDPLDVKETGTGGLNIIDLANINSCAFIATEDIGSIAADGTFQVLGRMDHSALRGCSLMVV